MTKGHGTKHSTNATGYDKEMKTPIRKEWGRAKTRDGTLRNDN